MNIIEESSASHDISCQTEVTQETIACIEKDNKSLRSEIIHIKGCTDILSPELFFKNQEMLKFYTGLPNWTIFNAVMKLVSPSLPNSKLSTFQMIVMFLMKIRLNLFDEDIGFRFSVHRTTVSRNFHKVLDVMYVKHSHLIKWPDRETLRFRHFLKRCCIIIDCTEVFIEQPSDLIEHVHSVEQL